MNKIRTKIIVAILALTFIADASFCRDKKYKSFNRYFTFVDTISFDIDSLLIGDISDVIVLGDEKYVIRDPVLMCAFWIDRENKRYKKLSFEKELPGVKNEVLALYKDPHNGFWGVIFKYYLKFDENGTLLSHYRNDKYYVSDKFCVDSLSNLIVYCWQERLEDNYLLYYDLKNNDINIMMELGFSGKYKNAIKRFIGGGLLIDADNYLYAANAVEDKIFKYNLSGKLIKCFQSKYVPFKSLDKDLLPGTEGIFEFFKRAKGRIPNTLLNRIGFISGKYIYAEYIGRKGKYIEVFSKEGDVVNKKSIRVPDGFLITGSYRKYIYFRPFVNHDEKPDEIRNPVLLKYEFTGRLKNR